MLLFTAMKATGRNMFTVSDQEEERHFKSGGSMQLIPDILKHRFQIFLSNYGFFTALILLLKLSFLSVMKTLYFKKKYPLRSKNQVTLLQKSAIFSVFACMLM